VFQRFVCVLLVNLSAVSWASEPLPQRIDQRIKHSSISKKDLALIVMKLEHGKRVTVYKHREKDKMIPASLSKIFTAGAVIDKLSPNHRFVTQLMTSGAIENGVLKGDLFLKGGGDPSFVSENMWFLVNEFIRSDIRQIEGDVVVDISLFDDDFYPGRSDKRVDRAYDAPVAAMSFNWNSVNVYLRPGDKINSPVKVKIDPMNDYIELKNRAKTTKKKSYAVSRDSSKSKDVITVTGSYPLGAEEKPVYKSITRPALWSGYNLRAFLQRRGVQVKGQVRRGKAPATASVVAEAESKPLAHVLGDLMKFSNNYVAEMLTKNLAVAEGKKGNNQDGLKAIRQHVKSLGYKANDFTMVNASGLNRDNRFTVDQIVTGLTYVRGRFDLAPEFMTSLPIAGVDGTLERRMAGTAAERWVRAKTGLLNGVVGLAGFAGQKDGDILAFAFLFNGKAGYEVTARSLFDQLATELVQ
jgi:D-alanyl-D-alanine carboxypeptidase/D-alanyl-D-alanine-endopeptidase (penicillin-binding protein 4)